MTNATFLLIALAAALAVFFGVSWYGALVTERSKTEVQRRQDRINAESAARRRLPLGRRIAQRLSRYGWSGPLTPLAWGATLLYLMIAVGLSMAGFGGWAGVIVAVPLTVAITLILANSRRSKQQREFQEQLVSAFDQFAGQLRSASSPAKAFENVIPGLPEPLRSELGQALEQHRSARPLDEAIAEVAERYPSRAMALFVAALRMDHSRGGKLAPALEQASEILRKDFELRAETNAEIAQERAQFFGIVGIVSFIAFTSITRAGDEARGAFTSFLGIAVLSVFIANFLFGVFRVLRIFSRAKGGY
jgi:tight adherence protein B